MNHRQLLTTLLSLGGIGTMALALLFKDHSGDQALTYGHTEQGVVIFDAGAIFAEDRPSLDHTFHLKNSSSQRIKLVNKLCTCTCTTTRLEPDVLAPGEVGTLTMSMKMTDALATNNSISCELHFDDGTSKSFSMVYRLFPKMMVDREYIDFGTFSSEDRGVTPTIDVNVLFFAPPGRRLPSLKSVESPAGFEVERMADSQEVEADGTQRRRYSIRVLAKPETDQAEGDGVHVRSVRFIADDGSSATTNVLWRQSVWYRYSPSPISFGIVDPGGPIVTREATLSGPSGDLIQIGSIESNSPHMKVYIKDDLLVSEPGSSQRIELKLEVPPNFQADVISGLVEARMDDARHSTVQLPWSAIVRAPRSPGAGEDPVSSEEGGTR